MSIPNESTPKFSYFESFPFKKGAKRFFAVNQWAKNLLRSSAANLDGPLNYKSLIDEIVKFEEREVVYERRKAILGLLPPAICVAFLIVVFFNPSVIGINHSDADWTELLSEKLVGVYLSSLFGLVYSYTKFKESSRHKSIIWKWLQKHIKDSDRLRPVIFDGDFTNTDQIKSFVLEQLKNKFEQ